MYNIYIYTYIICKGTESRIDIDTSIICHSLRSWTLQGLPEHSQREAPRISSLSRSRGELCLRHFFFFGGGWRYGYGSIPINTIFSGMNIHLPAILMFTRGTRFWHTAILLYPTSRSFSTSTWQHAYLGLWQTFDTLCIVHSSGI